MTATRGSRCVLELLPLAHRTDLGFVPPRLVCLLLSSFSWFSIRLFGAISLDVAPLAVASRQWGVPSREACDHCGDEVFVWADDCTASAPSCATQMVLDAPCPVMGVQKRLGLLKCVICVTACSQLGLFFPWMFDGSHLMAHAYAQVCPFIACCLPCLAGLARNLAPFLTAPTRGLAE